MSMNTKIQRANGKNATQIPHDDLNLMLDMYEREEDLYFEQTTYAHEDVYGEDEDDNVYDEEDEQN